MNNSLKTLIAVLIALILAPVSTAIEVHRAFGDRMVLQRDAAVPVSGSAQPNAGITVQFAGQKLMTKADAKGKWHVDLAPLSASAEPREFVVTSDKDEQPVTFSDVLVGDVWVGSGQSNMAGRVSSYAKNDETLAALAQQPLHANIRLMNGGPKPAWKFATKENVAQFSALLFAFGERLSRELDVPVGLIVGAVGGTPSGLWIPAETFAESAACKESIAESSKTYDEQKELDRYKAQLAAWEKRVAKAKADGSKPRGRKPLPPGGPGSSSRGGKIGGLYERYIEPVSGYRIRGVLWDQGEARSGVVGVSQFTLMTELIRGWRQVWGQGEFPFLFVQKTSGGGCAFSNDNPVTRNGDQFTKVPTTIPQPPAREGRTFDRVMYSRLMKTTPNGWMVPVSDLGSGVHPTNKWGYGNRAADVALQKVYSHTIQAYGPIYRSHDVDGDKIVVSFDEVGKGLTTAHSDTLQGFAVAGENGEWQWADARIDGDKVIVWSEKVPQPQRVRYAFAQKRAWANLFNKDGLPALAFETPE